MNRGPTTALAAIVFTTAFLPLAHGAPIINKAPRPVIVVPHSTTMPRGDGDPADPAWADAAVIPSLSISLGPSAGMVPYPTQVKLLWDEDYLYVRFVCTDDEIYAPFHDERDANHYQGDVAEVFLDPVGDAREYMELELSPDNGLMDQIWLCTGKPVAGQDGRLLGSVIQRNVWSFLSWTLDYLETGTGRFKQGEGGWIADFAIPANPTLRRLGETRFHPMTLRANFMRYDWDLVAGQAERRLVPMNWAPVSWGSPHVAPTMMGYLKLVGAPVGE